MFNKDVKGDRWRLRMENQGGFMSGGGRGLSGLGEGGRSWEKVAQGISKQSMWTSHKISEEEIEDLQ